VTKVFDPPLQPVWREDIASAPANQHDAAERLRLHGLRERAGWRNRMDRPNGGHPSAKRAKPTFVTVD
jgi:hypothetical protein